MVVPLHPKKPKWITQAIKTHARGLATAASLGKKKTKNEKAGGKQNLTKQQNVKGF